MHQVGRGANTSEVVVQLGKEDKPRGIDLDVCEGMVYWTNWNRRNPAIQRAYYSGYNKQDLITENVHMPNGLALDLPARKLYWADARLDKIEVTEHVVVSVCSGVHAGWVQLHSTGKIPGGPSI